MQHLFFPPCPYCGGGVTAAFMEQAVTPIYSTSTSPTSPTYWTLTPCNHYAGDYYTVTVATGSAVVPAVDAVPGTTWVAPNGAMSVKTHHGWEPLPSGSYVTLQGGHAMTFGASWYEAVGGATVLNDLGAWLPGLREYVCCPECELEQSVQDVIQHLNDRHVWTREAVADWLETLDVDLTFPTDKPPPRPEPASAPWDEPFANIAVLKDKLKLEVELQISQPMEYIQLDIVKTKPHEPPDAPAFEKALDHKASQSSHWAKFNQPTNPLKKKKKKEH